MSTNIGVTLMTNVYVHFRVNVFVGIDLGMKENWEWFWIENIVFSCLATERKVGKVIKMGVWFTQLFSSLLSEEMNECRLFDISAILSIFSLDLHRLSITFRTIFSLFQDLFFFCFPLTWLATSLCCVSKHCPLCTPLHPQNLKNEPWEYPTWS